MINRLIVDNYSKIQYTLISILILFPIFPRGVESILLISMIFISLCYIVLEGKKSWTFKKSKLIVMLACIFFVFTVSALYSSDFNVAIKYLIKSLPLIGLPMVFIVSDSLKVNKPFLQRITWFYVLALFFLLLFLNILFFNDLYDLKISPYHLRRKIENITDVHGTYLSMWIGFGVLLFLSYIISSTRKGVVVKILLFLLIAYFFYWLFLLKARMPFVSTVIGILFLLGFKVNFSIKQIVFILVIMLGGIVLMFRNDIISKIQVIENYEKAIPAGKYENLYPFIKNEQIRSVIYHCSWESIKENPFFGLGIGDVDGRLQSCYDSDFAHTDVFKIQNYNSHSQYFQILLATGGVGLVLCLISYFTLLKITINKSNHLYLIFLIFSGLCFCFENILSRHDGVLFFSLFGSILFFLQDETNQLK